jgi:hypothetical protein
MSTSAIIDVLRPENVTDVKWRFEVTRMRIRNNTPSVGGSLTLGLCAHFTRIAAGCVDVLEFQNELLSRMAKLLRPRFRNEICENFCCEEKARGHIHKLGRLGQYSVGADVVLALLSGMRSWSLNRGFG